VFSGPAEPSSRSQDPEQPLPRFVSEATVDPFEVVQVYDQHGYRGQPSNGSV
jgi:hypothetical protein